uniref:DNA (cytosine-5-)-methyltransferase n=1 Tax=Fagus sylvatica TaxID=28930 RepID=A0A2N9ILK4_FAGSY
MLSMLVDMGYLAEEALMAMDKCGPNAQLSELADFICAAQMVNDFDAQLRESSDEEDNSSAIASYSYRVPREKNLPREKKRKLHKVEKFESKCCKGSRKKHVDEDEDILHLPNPMIGFGVPDGSWSPVRRNLTEAASSPPYFYYENVALTPKGVWSKISRFLYDIEPEFVDSKYFCAAARKRGYIHNLPIDNRFPLLPIPPRTIQEALPLSKKWWPLWDKRTKLNCLQTAIGSAKLTDRILNKLKGYSDEHEPPPSVQKEILEQCRKWNLVWVGKNKVAPLDPSEMEMLLGFPRDHTRGGGINTTDRYKALGNSFQVDTVAYHLSVLKNQFPNGINILSLFSGIGGAEVALHRLGIPLKNVVSVEISEVNRNIIRSWWEQTDQRGDLIEISDVQQVTIERLDRWISSFGGFDLIIGGSPCNNLAGSNRVSRDGLEGKQSSLFYEYYRILDVVKLMMGRYR